MSEKGAYLSEAIDFNSFKLGTFNLIVAPCGSGKTTAAFHTIPNYLKVEPRRSLILINTASGADSFVMDGYGYYFDYNGPEWDANFTPQYDKPTIMTYAAFGAQVKKGDLNPEEYDYLVCDEIHSLNQYIAIARAKLLKQYPQAAPWEINDMLQITCFNYIAVETIFDMVKEGKSWIFGLTATPSQLYKNDLKKLGAIVNEVQYSQKLRAYEIFCKFDYAEIEPILRAIVPENRKRMFFFNTIKELKQYKKILMECGRAAEALWALNPDSGEYMDNHQLTTRDFILKEHRFPNDVQDLLINRAYETAITIKDPLVKEAYIHSGNKDTRDQARNRLRQDLEVVGYYNYQAGKAARKKLNLNSSIEDSIKNIPLTYFNKPLYTRDKEELIKVINFPKKWTSLKKALVQQGYSIEDKNDGKARYSIIHYIPDVSLSSCDLE